MWIKWVTLFTTRQEKERRSGGVVWMDEYDKDDKVNLRREKENIRMNVRGQGVRKWENGREIQIREGKEGIMHT